jgi:amidase
MAAGTATSEEISAAYLARIAAYDKQGPTLNTVIVLNPKALDTAKALDAERKAGKVRGPLHGIPIVLKDNYGTVDLQTTAGSQLLEGWVPPADAFMVKKLRDAGAVILAKVNLSEFAAGGSVGVPPSIGGPPNGFSSMGGQTRNPHDLTRGPAGSSGGTGSAIAAVFAQFGLGSDTGGSIRGPCSSNGIAGIKPTNGLVSRAGIVPLALTFDTGGPMARNVYDVAVALGAMTGVDPADPLTKISAGKFQTDYTKFLKVGSLKGARIGVARDFMGKDAEVDRVIEASIAKLKELGAVIIDPIKYPDFVLQARTGIFLTVLNAEFKAQIADYFAAIKKPGYPKTFAEMVAKVNDPAFGYRSPEKAAGLKYTDGIALDLTDPVYLAAHDQGLGLVRAGVQSLFEKYKLDAIVYPTGPRPATPIAKPATPPLSPAGMGDSPSSIANMTGWPDLIVPAGMTNEGLPVTLSFFGPAFSEPKLFGYGYDFEQATHARVLPKNTPMLAADGSVPKVSAIPAPAGALPKIKLFATGGTIQGSGDNRDNIANYRAGQIKAPQIIADLPELKSVADLSFTEIASVASGGVDTKILLKLANEINTWLALPEATGAVVTHGTATIEETAYFLQLVVKSDKPVVVVGAMRPFTGLSRDGPLNFYNAVRTAACPDAVGKGVLVLLNDTIHSARFVTKNNTYRVDTFVSRELGPIGYADSDRVVFYRTPLTRHTSKSEFDVSKLETLPAVDIVYGYQEASGAPLEALIAAGVKGIVLDDSAPSFNRDSLLAMSKGIVIVQSDRKGSGRVLLSERSAGRGTVSSDNLNAQKARILLRLALTKTSNAAEIQRMFNEY